MPKNRLKIVVEGNYADKKKLTAILKKGVKVLKSEGYLTDDLLGIIEINFVNDEKIMAVNKAYREKNKATDVISLSYLHEIFPGDDLIGEIFISLETARRQAEEHGHDYEDEITFLFVHGLLHIFGFDHVKKKERDEMFRLQDEILA
jgi:probable rRNA maturation factor